MPAALPIKINIGCGLSGAVGWVNIDNSPTVLLSRVPIVRRLLRVPAWPKDVRRHDVVRRGLPFPDQSVEYIYSSHTFEHFCWQDALSVVRECLRVLQPAGVLRVCVPDLRYCMAKYAEDLDPLASHRFIQRLGLGHTLQDIVHPGSHHSQMFDERSLLHLFREAGFPDPRVSGFGESRIPDIAAVELDARKHESLYVEAAR